MSEAGHPNPVTGAKSANDAVKRAFGVDNRARLLDEYFRDVGSVPPYDAWTHVYRLLLWIDRTIGLAHCYESDKCQPGRPWYLRSLRFHDWVSTHLDVTPDALVEHIDWLFNKVVLDLASASEAAQVKDASLVAKQREPYAGRGFPEPGEDPELIEIILDILKDWFPREKPPVDVRRALTKRITAHFASENKRKNLLGEGFEDTLAALLRQVPGIQGVYDIYVRRWLHELPGFNRPRRSMKPRQVDLALVRKKDGYRILITAKWSVRSDREEQFRADFNDYADLESHGQDFGYVLITNEFDAARLVRACDNRRQNAYLFSDVVHVNVAGPLAAYDSSTRGNVSLVRHRIDDGRLISLGDWLTKVLHEGGL